MRRRWVQLAKLDGGAKGPDEILECIRWSVDTARDRGRTVNYPNQAVHAIKEWKASQRGEYRRAQKAGAA